MDLFVNKKDKSKNLSNSVNVTSNLDSISSMNPNLTSTYSSNNPNNPNNRKLYHSTSVNFGYDNSALRQRTSSRPTPSRQNSFLYNSINSSLDFPTYIPWQTLSSEVNENLKSGALRINKSNCLEWASPIKEDNEKAALLNEDIISSGSDLDDTGVTRATHGGISWQVASFLLVNCALGAGILNYPQAYDKVGGILLATIFQLILMVMLGLTMIILVYSSDLNNDNTFHDVILSMCGKRMQQVAAISILMTCYGICVTFLIIIGNQLEKISESLMLDQSLWYFDRKFVITALAVTLIMPLCYFKRLDFLKYAGALGVFSMFYVVFLNIYQYFYLNCQQVELRTKPESFKSMLAVIPVICFAYQTHEIAVPVYASMRTRNVRNFTKSTILTLTILFVLYSMAGTFAYLTFGLKVSSNIMMMYDTRQPIVLIGACALAIKMITTYPSILFCGRNALDGLYAEYFKITTDEIIKGERKRRYVTTTLWFATTLVLAIYTPNIGVVIELLGSLASMNTFIFPALCLISIVESKREKFSKLAKLVMYSFAIFLILFGVVLFFLVIWDVYLELTDLSEDVLLNVTMCKHV